MMRLVVDCSITEHLHLTAASVGEVFTANDPAELQPKLLGGTCPCGDPQANPGLGRHHPTFYKRSGLWLLNFATVHLGLHCFYLQ